MQKIAEIFDKEKLDYSAVCVGTASIVLFALGHSPYNFENGDILQLDAHYPAYVQMHLIKNRLVNELKQAGFSATTYRDDHYKPLVVSSGLVSEGFNNLMHHSQYGTRFVLQAIKIDDCDFEKTGITARNLECASCQKCIQACPFDALDFDGTKHIFTREKCLRQCQADGCLDDFQLQKMGNKFLGCSICQDVCPSNANIPPVMPDKAYTRLFDRQTLIQNFESGNLEPYEIYLGKNYTKKSGHWLNIIKQLKN